ncbi:MAG: 16S rRNA (cytosine(967)-C(5))-methyltransferase RsmB [Cyanobacteria bacterium]|nr:16S rRNA (cytosine(967)-C(5))-methyltransferase RsmB [Cyanobacteriota bacterium]
MRELHIRCDTPRHAAFEVLNQLDHAFSHRGDGLGAIRRLNVHQLMGSLWVRGTAAGWSDQDRVLFHQICDGVVRFWHPLNWILDVMSHHPLDKLQPEVRTLTRMGLYQLYYLNRVPDYAAVDTTMKVAMDFNLTSPARSFIHGVLRRFQGQEESHRFPWPDSKSEESVMIKTGWPVWLLKYCETIYGVENTHAMAMASVSPPPMSVRVNLLCRSIDEYKLLLDGEKIEYKQPDPETLPEVLILKNYSGPVVNLPGFPDGCVYIQDVNSAWVSAVVNPQSQERILDFCAAPGSKTTHMAAKMMNQGEIVAYEVVHDRRQHLEENIERLRIANITIPHTEPSVESWGLFDAVLVDAPCTGLGTVRKNPDILLKLSQTEFYRMHAEQVDILEQASAFVRPGGRLIYSTCSLSPEENQKTTQAFLECHPEEYRLAFEEQRLITAEQDGFYIAVLPKAE